MSTYAQNQNGQQVQNGGIAVCTGIQGRKKKQQASKQHCRAGKAKTRGGSWIAHSLQSSFQRSTRL